MQRLKTNIAGHMINQTHSRGCSLVLIIMLRDKTVAFSSQTSIIFSGDRELSFQVCEVVGVVKRVHILFGGVHRLATALKEVEEEQEEVQEIRDEWEDEEVEENGGLKVEGEPLITCVDEMTCATPLSQAVQCES